MGAEPFGYIFNAHGPVVNPIDEFKDLLICRCNDIACPLQKEECDRCSCPFVPLYEGMAPHQPEEESSCLHAVISLLVDGRMNGSMQQ